jgi:hypothetical protein
MKIKTLVITVAALAALSVLAYLKNRPEAPPAADARVGKPVLDADTAQKASSITVADQGKTVTVAKGPDGAWTVPSYFGLPADFEKIARLVQDLNEAKVERFVTDNPERLSRLGFKDSVITLGDAAGKPIWTLTLGKAPDSGNGRFLKFGDEPKAYLSGTSVWLDTDPKAWANANLVAVKPDEVARVEIPVAGKTYIFTRPKKDAPWSAEGGPAGEKPVQDKVTSTLSTLTGLRFSETVDPKDPAAAAAHEHDRTLSFTTFGGLRTTVTLGRKPEVKKLKAPTKEESKQALESLAKATDAKEPAKLVEPEYDTTPAGPVFVSVSSSDPRAPVNSMMAKRAFEADDYVFTSLPDKESDLFEAAKPAK